MGITDEGADSIAEQVKVTRDLGWKWIEARNVQVDGFDKGCIHDIPDAAFDRVVEAIEGSGVGIYAFGSTICNWAKTIDTPWKVTLDEVMRTIPRMKRLGTKYVRIMSFKPPDDTDRTSPVVFERIAEVTRMFLDEGLQPVHENCMNHGGMSWQHAVELLEQVPGIKWVFDTGNPIFNSDRSKARPWPKQDPLEFWRHVKDHTAHIHIKDGVWNAEKNETEFTFPGEGQGQVREILRDAFASGYDAGISIEPHMTVVFHDAASEAKDQDMYDNYMEYGRRMMRLIDEVKAELKEAAPATG